MYLILQGTIAGTELLNHGAGSYNKILHLGHTDIVALLSDHVPRNDNDLTEPDACGKVSRNDATV